MSKLYFGAVLAAVLTFGTVQTVRGEQAAEQSGKADAWSEIVSLFKSGQSEAAYRLALRHENDGDIRIVCVIGDCLCDGIGTKADTKRAFEYYRKAAERIPYAKFRMGILYAAGEGVPCDKDKALELMDEALAAGFRPNEALAVKAIELLRTGLSEYTDPALKVKFPSRSPKFELKWHQRYLNPKVWGYSLRYRGENAWLDLYIYDHGWGVVPDGVSQLSDKAIADAEDEVRQAVRSGTYKNFRDRTETRKGVLPLSKLEYSWFSFVYDHRANKGLRSVILIFGARGKFFKIRYSGMVEKDVPPDQLPTMVAELLQQLDAALAAK